MSTQTENQENKSIGQQDQNIEQVNNLKLENTEQAAQENVQHEEQNTTKVANQVEVTNEKISEKQNTQQVQNTQQKSVNKDSFESPIKDFEPKEYKQQSASSQQNNENEETKDYQQDREEYQQGSYEFKGKSFQSYQKRSPQNQSYQDSGKYKEQWSEIYEHEMIAHSSMDRKRQNLEMLREWDRKRAYFLNVHRSLIETIIAQVDIKMQTSNQFMQFIIHYFQNKAQQELQYARQPIPKPDAALMNNEIAKSIYGHLQKGLQLLDDGNFEHSKKVSQFAYTLEHDILQELLVLDYNQSLSTLHTLQSEITALKRQMSNLNDVTSRKSGKVAQVYNMSTPKTGYKKITTKPKDLYRTQLNFLRHANNQTEVQRKLARTTLQFWEGSRDIEKNRGKSIAKALSLFKEAFVACYGESQQFQESVEFISTGFNEQNIEEQFSINSIFSSSDIDFLREQLIKNGENLEGQEKPGFKYDDIIPFFENFVVEKFDNRLLILKDLKTQRQYGANGSYKDTHLVITADNYLQCFDSSDINSQILAHLFSKPNFSLSLNKSILRRVSTHNFLVELSIQQAGFLNYIAGSDKYFFNFRNSDEIEELAQFINSLN